MLKLAAGGICPKNNLPLKIGRLAGYQVTGALASAVVLRVGCRCVDGKLMGA